MKAHIFVKPSVERINSVLLTLFFACTTFLSVAQITLTPGLTVVELTQDVLTGASIEALNITFNGIFGNPNNAQQGVQLFSIAPGTNFPFESGVILRTDNAPTVNGDADLNALAGPFNVTNGSIVEFDFVATGDTMTFQYIFASSEYTSYTCSSFNDAFGFFLSGPGIAGPYTNGAINLATIPGTNTPVAINTVNSGFPANNPTCLAANPNYMTDNIYFTLSYNSIMTPIGDYNGATVALIATAGLVCDETYHIKLGVANVGDQALQSAVFLEVIGITAPQALITSSTGNNELCQGTTLTLFANDGESFLWNTGEQTNSIQVSNAGTYSVEVTYANGCSSNTAVFEVEEVPTPTPIIQILGDSVICEGDSVTLQASGGQIYLWSNGMIGPNITVGNSGSYTVTTFNCSCVGTSDSVQVYVIDTNINVAASSTEICYGDQVQLSATGVNNISWSDEIQNGISFVPEITATYEVTGTNANGCEGTASITITVNPIPQTSEIVGVISVACDSNSEIYGVETTAGSTYLWTVPEGAQIIYGQGTNSIVINFNGNFGDIALIETSGAGCLGEEQLLSVNCNLSMAPNTNYSLEVFPNPTKDMLNLNLINNAEKFEVLVYDNLGKILYQGWMHEQVQIDVRTLSHGMYNVFLIGEKITLITTFTKI